MDATIKDLLDAGAHFGHQSRYWNPKMKRYIYGTYNRINIINLEHTLTGLRRACEFVHDLARNRKKLLFVGTKKAAGEIIKEQVLSIGQYYVNHRWMGGTLTNYNIICASIEKLRDLQQQKAEGMFDKITKKEAMMRQRSMTKLERSIGGIKDMNGLPDALFVVDVRYEHIAVAEAKKLGIPVIGVVDTNSTPDNIDYIIPGNDDSIRSIRLFVEAITSSFSEGGQLAEQFSMMRGNREPAAQNQSGQRLAGTLSKLSSIAAGKQKEQPQQTQKETQGEHPIEAEAHEEEIEETQEMQGTQEISSQDNPIESTQKEEQNNPTESAADTDNPSDKPAKKDNPSSESASKVKELRMMSGAGIMECKTAIKEADGDINKAADILREKGIAKQLKRSDRAASEGVIAVKSEGDKTIVVELNCETDFVARNEEFVAFANNLAEIFYKAPPAADGEEPIISDELNAELQSITQKMGENIKVSSYRELTAPKGGTVAAYTHTNHKLCALVAIDADNSDLARDLAMQVAAMSPLAATPDQVPQELLDKEKEIFLAQIKDEDKPDDIKEKMIAGKLKKFTAEVSLSEQSFIKNPEQKISSLLKDAGVKEIKFIRHEVGK